MFTRITKESKESCNGPLRERETPTIIEEAKLTSRGKNKYRGEKPAITTSRERETPTTIEEIIEEVKLTSGGQNIDRGKNPINTTLASTSQGCPSSSSSQRRKDTNVARRMSNDRPSSGGDGGEPSPNVIQERLHTLESLKSKKSKEA